MKVLFVISIHDSRQHTESELVKRGLELFRVRINPSLFDIVGVRNKAKFEPCSDSLVRHFQLTRARDMPSLTDYDAVISLQSEHAGYWKPSLKLRRRG